MKARTLIAVVVLSLATMVCAQNPPTQPAGSGTQPGASVGAQSGSDPQTTGRTEQSAATGQNTDEMRGCPCMSGGGHGHGMMMRRGMGEGMREHVEAMKANVAKLRTAVGKMQPGAARDAEQAQLAMWEQLVQHMEQMSQGGMMGGDPHHGGMGMGKGHDPHHAMPNDMHHRGATAGQGQQGATSGTKGGAQKGTTPKTDTGESAKPTSPK